MVLENTAANSVSMAQNLLDAAHAQETPGRIIAIALAANTFACLLHTISRKWGIILNNVFGTVKFIILVFILIIGLIWVNRDVANTNLGIKTSFSTQNSPRLPFRYAEAMIYVIYPYGAFHQINYVCFNLAEGQSHLLVSYTDKIRLYRSSKSHEKLSHARPVMECLPW